MKRFASCTSQQRWSRIPLSCRLRSGALFGAGLLALLGTSGCLGGGGSPSNVAGTGRATFFLESIEWGRLVDVFDVNGVLAARDVLIRESLQEDPLQTYRLSTNPLTQSEVLTINQPAGSAAFTSLLRAAQSGRAAIKTNGMDSPGPFSLVARNGAIRLQFSELLAPASVNRQTVQCLVGDPPVQNQQVRYLVDNSTLGADGKPKGVIIIDPTISLVDSTQLGIPENGVGFPNSFDTVTPNIVIRIPTSLEPAFGQTMILTNQAGNNGLQVRPSDPFEYSPLLNKIVVRAFRTGNDKDPYNGFMLDLKRPELIAEFEVSIANVAQGAGNVNQRTLTYSIDALNCREITPKVGDVFEIDQALFQVSKLENVSNPAAYLVSGAILDGEVPVGNYGASPLRGSLTTPYRAADSVLQMCWVGFSPAPSYALPARGVDPFASVTIRFNEPVDVATIRSLETVVLTSYNLGFSSPTDPSRPFEPGNETVGDYIDRQIGFEGVANFNTGSGRIKLGPIAASLDSRSFTLSPSAGLTDAHDEGDNMRLCLALRDGTDGILDLAGNSLAFDGFVAGNLDQNEILTRGPFTPWPSERYFALRFNSTDEDTDGLSEYIGQFVFEPGILRGRDLVRFSRAADATNPYVGQRIQYSQGLMTPLTPAGAVLHGCYPYHLLGLGLTASAEMNLDIEGMGWSPFGGSVFDDVFPIYSLALSHANRFPDDYVDPASGYPAYPNSGLQRNKTFDDNILGFPDIKEQVVGSGFYQISAVNLYSAITGTTMYPWMNFASTYTWRDTNIPAKASLDGPAYLGGTSGGGVPPRTTGATPIYTAGFVPSIASPLLVRYRCWPRGNEFGSNGFQVQIMCGSSALPAFRVFSAGGRDAAGNWHQVIPDDPGAGGTQPIGGYNTTNGFVTKGYGPELYWTDVDFVVRISRVYTHWFQFGGTLDLVTNITTEPSPELQPPGTSVVVEFRGSSNVNQANCSGTTGPLADANKLDYYGDYNETCATIATPTGWRPDLSSFIGQYGYFQVRFSFVSNLQQNVSPMLDAFGFAWNVR